MLTKVFSFKESTDYHILEALAPRFFSKKVVLKNTQNSKQFRGAQSQFNLI